MTMYVEWSKIKDKMDEYRDYLLSELEEEDEAIQESVLMTHDRFVEEMSEGGEWIQRTEKP